MWVDTLKGSHPEQSYRPTRQNTCTCLVASSKIRTTMLPDNADSEPARWLNIFLHTMHTAKRKAEASRLIHLYFRKLRREGNQRLAGTGSCLTFNLHIWFQQSRSPSTEGHPPYAPAQDSLLSCLTNTAPWHDQLAQEVPSRLDVFQGGDGVNNLESSQTCHVGEVKVNHEDQDLTGKGSS